MVEWYSGGQERKKVALRLLAELYQSSDCDVLRNFFRRYIENLNGEISVPFALSAFNLELSSVLIKNKITLSKEQVRIKTTVQYPIWLSKLIDFMI